jgi:hypothetical protein
MHRGAISSWDARVKPEHDGRDQYSVALTRSGSALS